MPTKAERAADLRLEYPELYERATDDTWILNDWARKAASGELPGLGEAVSPSQEALTRSLERGITGYERPGKSSGLKTGAKAFASSVAWGVPELLGGAKIPESVPLIGGYQLPEYYTAQELEEHPYIRTAGDILGGFAGGGVVSMLGRNAAKVAGRTALRKAAPYLAQGFAQGAGQERARQNVVAQQGGVQFSDQPWTQLGAMGISGLGQAAGNIIPMVSKAPSIKRGVADVLGSGAVQGFSTAGAQGLTEGRIDPEYTTALALSQAIMGLGFHTAGGLARAGKNRIDKVVLENARKSAGETPAQTAERLRTAGKGGPPLQTPPPLPGSATTTVVPPPLPGTGGAAGTTVVTPGGGRVVLPTFTDDEAEVEHVWTALRKLLGEARNIDPASKGFPNQPYWWRRKLKSADPNRAPIYSKYHVPVGGKVRYIERDPATGKLLYQGSPTGHLADEGPSHLLVTRHGPDVQKGEAEEFTIEGGLPDDLQQLMHGPQPVKGGKRGEIFGYAARPGVDRTTNKPTNDWDIDLFLSVDDDYGKRVVRMVPSDLVKGDKELGAYALRYKEIARKAAENARKLNKNEALGPFSTRDDEAMRKEIKEHLPLLLTIPGMGEKLARLGIKAPNVVPPKSTGGNGPAPSTNTPPITPPPADTGRGDDFFARTAAEQARLRAEAAAAAQGQGTSAPGTPGEPALKTIGEANAFIPTEGPAFEALTLDQLRLKYNEAAALLSKADKGQGPLSKNVRRVLGQGIEAYRVRMESMKGAVDMVTRGQARVLAERGFTEERIRELTKAQAQNLIDKNARGGAPIPAPAAATGNPVITPPPLPTPPRAALVSPEMAKLQELLAAARTPAESGPIRNRIEALRTFEERQLSDEAAATRKLGGNGGISA